MTQDTQTPPFDARSEVELRREAIQRWHAHAFAGRCTWEQYEDASRQLTDAIERLAVPV